MTDREHFWRLEHLSDRQLLERLQGVLRRQRYALAELIAHLGEVEDRRLHLAAAHGSMFSYCVQHLGMSEDEACRRIDLARLARRFPLLFGELGSGRINLSVALLLKPVLTADNHIELLAAARGASLRTARELLAARFPSPDVPSQIRKLPERNVGNVIPATGAHGPAAVAGVANARPEAVAHAMPEAIGSLQDPITGAEPSHSPAQACVPCHSILHQPRGPRARIEPLSAGRYRIQFTADASLKQKLELARDLSRHSSPSGDLAPVVSRALDLLLQELMQRRFGARRKDTPQQSARRASHAASVPTETPQTLTPQLAMPPSTTPDAAPSPTYLSTATPQSSTLPFVADTLAIPPSAAATSHIPRAARRAVLERDGLGCGWVDAAGQRCGSTAWLELDHCHPAGKGGSSEPENVRLLCRAHNRFAAERAYGREHVERAIRARKGGVKRRGQSGRPPSPSPAPA